MVTLTGKIETEYIPYIKNENLHTFYIRANRQSGTSDIIPVIIRSDLIDLSFNPKGKACTVFGDISSRFHNGHKEIYVFAKDLSFTLDADINFGYITGHICSKPITRLTPSGRQISDFIIATNDSNYIQCISWESVDVSQIEVGNFVTLCGRLQSRTYTKNGREHTVVEMSVCRVVKYA